MADEEKKEMPFITKALIIAIIAVLVVVLSSGIAFFVASTAVNGIAAKLQSGSVATTEHKEEAKEEETPGEIVNFGEYTINLNEPETTYLAVQINFEVKKLHEEKKAAKKEAAAEGESSSTPPGEVGEKLVILQDIINSVFAAKTKAELSEDPSKIALRKEIMDKINPLLKEEKVTNVYFSKWLIQ